MKQCNKCLKRKDETEFHKKSNTVDKLNHFCKQCVSELNTTYRKSNSKFFKKYSKQFRQSKRLPYYIVYILPISHYAGITNNSYFRMVSHKFNERDITGWYEVARYNTKKEALAHEAQLHSQGYNGMNPKHQVISV
jgi:hypothetical protein